MIDVDAELTTSFAGVLERDGVGSPIPPADNIAGGFEMVRANRQKTIEALLKEPHTAYQLFATLPDGSKVLVAEIKPLQQGEDMPANPRDRLIVDDKYKELFQAIAPAHDEAKLLKSAAAGIGNREITPELIEQVTANLEPGYRDKLRAALIPHIGKTWKEAVDEWSKKSSSGGAK